ncbi:MAG: metallophosphoesterase [Proteobacteria bacterium]|nr:metallophosphoesterase [Pseudomonadota bacterium]
MKKILISILFLTCLVSCQSPEQNPEPAPNPAPAVEPVTPPATEPISDDLRYPPAPELPPAPDTLKIAVISDLNASYGTIGYPPNVKRAVQDIVNGGYDFVLSPGDLIAGQKHGLDYEGMWKAFHYQVDDVFFDNNLEFIFAPGNHDASAFSQYANERYYYEKAFENRRPKAPLLPGSHFPFYYGVMIRDVRVIALDITRPISNNDPQLDWLESVLQEDVNPRATLVLGHLPISPVNIGQFYETVGSTRLLSLLQKTPKTIYISGHHHIFYPGHIGELRTIAMPALGYGARKLLGAPAVGGYVQIIIPPEGQPRVIALVSPTFKRMINTETLPEHLFQASREDKGMAEFIMEMLDDSAKEAIK